MRGGRGGGAAGRGLGQRAASRQFRLACAARGRGAIRALAVGLFADCPRRGRVSGVAKDLRGGRRSSRAPSGGPNGSRQRRPRAFAVNLRPRLAWTRNRRPSERKTSALETRGGGSPDLNSSLLQVNSAAKGSSFDSAYEEHFTFVWRCLRSLGVTRAQLDDAAQEVFLVVHRRLDTFEGSSSLRGWLFGIVRHVAFNQRRTMKRRASRCEPLDGNLRSSAPGPHESAEDSEAAAFLEH